MMAGLSKDAVDVLAVVEGSWPSAFLPETGMARVRGFLALHELVRLDYFETRDNTFVELLVTPAQAAAGSGRIEERANVAAIEELHKALAPHPGATFGIARCDEVDFAGIWQLPIDMVRREEHLRTYAHTKLPAQCVVVAEPELGADPHTVVFVVIAPPRR